MTSSPGPVGERCEALVRAIDAGDTEAVGRFWRGVEETGAPLVEEIGGGGALVTFVWRGADAAAVVLQSPLGGVEGMGGLDLSRNRLTRLPGTDVWYRTFALPAGTRTQYEIGVAASAEAVERGWDAFEWRTDPLNPRRHVFPSDPEGTFQGYSVSVLDLPDAPSQPWTEPRADLAAGTVEQRRVPGPKPADSRRVWLYAPAVGRPSGLLVLFDGWVYANVIAAPTILDNLIAAGRIPPTAALLVDNPDRRADLGLDERFVDFVANELVPLARGALDAPSHPESTIVGGSSAGGLAAVFAALRRLDVFGNVLSQSGAFWWKGPDGAYEWLTRQVARSAALPLRVYLDAGSLEGRQFQDAPTQAEANRNLRDALRAKGASVTYAEFPGGHDHLWWRGTLADGLIALLGER